MGTLAACRFALADDKGFPYRGKVVSVAEDIDPKTHTQRWQAVVPNKDGIFMPGMSVRVRVITSEPHNVMLVPQGCHGLIPAENPNSEVVRVVNDRNIIESRNVQIGGRYDRLDAVTAGLKAADWVVADPSKFGGFPDPGMTIAPERFNTPPPPWALISVPPAVSVARPVAREVTDYEIYTGHVGSPLVTSVVVPVQGELEKVYFKRGQIVKQGDLMAEVLPRAELFNLAPLRESWKKAEESINPKDGGPALSGEAERQRTAKAAEKAKAAREALDGAWAKLPRRKIFAPCGGRIEKIDSPDPETRSGYNANVEFARITSLDSTSAYFDVNERTVIHLRRSMAGQKPGWELALPVSCGLADDQDFPIHGKVSSVDSGIDPKFGIQFWNLVLPNKDGVLVPGMLLRVRLAVSAPYKALLVPERAVGSDQGRKFVFVVDNQNAAERRDVEIGQLQDDGRRAVTKGLRADDRVILEHFRVQPGMTVKPEEPAAAGPARGVATTGAARQTERPPKRRSLAVGQRAASRRKPARPFQRHDHRRPARRRRPGTHVRPPLPRFAGQGRGRRSGRAGRETCRPRCGLIKRVPETSARASVAAEGAEPDGIAHQ